MKLSIIICTSKSGHFLKDCLSSLAEEEDTQYKKQIQIVLVEAHMEQSIKDRKQVYGMIETIKEKFSVKEVKLYDKMGPGAAKNYGMEHADGEYLLFLDDDDYLERGSIPAYFAAMEGNRQVIAFQTKTVWVGRTAYFGQSEKKETIQAESMLHHNQEWTQKEKAAYALIKEKGKLSQISALNILFQAKFLKNAHILFDEDNTLYPDLSFMAKVVKNLSAFQNIQIYTYCKRIHNDPIQNPSLSQIHSEARFDLYIGAYQRAKEIARGHPHERYLEELFVEYAVITYLSHIRKDEGSEQWAHRFKTVQTELACLQQPEKIKVRGYKKRALTAIKKGKAKKAVRIATRHAIYTGLKGMFRKRSTFCKELYRHLFYRFKVRKNYIMFESFLGRSYSDSPKYIYEYIQEQHPLEYKCIWVFRHTKKKLPYKAVKVKRFSIRYAYYLAVSKYFVYNMRQPVFMHVKEDQVFCETWHGIPMKRIMFDQEEITGPDKNYKKTAYKQSRQWKYLISPNVYCTAIFRRCFLFENKILETGYPRNDILHIDVGKKAEQIRAQLKIPEDRKVILYAPTFRDNAYYQLGEYKYESPLDFDKLRHMLGQEYVLLLRTHYLIADAVETSAVGDFVINVSRYEDISELYLVSDVLISDYSSVAFDFANLRRPMIFYMYDLEEYRDQLRGFYIDIEKELPGPIVTTQEQLIWTIKHLDDVTCQYEEKYQEFYKKYCSLEDGRSTERVVLQLLQGDKG